MDSDNVSDDDLEMGHGKSFNQFFFEYMHRISDIYEFPKGSAKRKQFVMMLFGNKNLLFRVGAENRTAFHYAVIHKCSDLVELLVNEARRLPSSANSCFLQTLLRQTNDMKNTALHKAVMHGDMESAKLLVEADPNHRHIQNIHGETPIYTAAKLGYHDILKMMCAICTVPAFDGPDGTTALHAAITRLPEAAYTEGSDVVEAILEADKQHFSNKDYITLCRQADNESKNTALHLAVRRNHLGVVKQILTADWSYKDKDNNIDLKTPLFIAAEQGYKNIVKELCKHYASSSSTPALGPRNHTVLHAAITGGDKDCVKMVLKWCSRLILYPDEVGWTPLHLASNNKFDSVIDMLAFTFSSHKALAGFPRVRPIQLDFNEDGIPTPFWLTIKGGGYTSAIHNGKEVPTPLWLSIEEGYTSAARQIIEILPDFCVELNHDNGQNILYLAADQSDKEMVQTILKYCPPIYLNKILNGKDKNGDTPLHLLISKGCFVKELIEHKGIDETTKNNDNWTPFDMLYLDDDILADQLQIKKALNTRVKHHSNCWGRSNKLNANTQESFVPPRKCSKKDAKFEKVDKKLMKDDLERYRGRTNTQIIVTAFITTVTFTVGFIMPGGYFQSGDLNQGMVLLSKKTIFNVFMLSDAIALALSTISLFLYFISSVYEDPHQVSNLNAISTVLNIFSVAAMMATFITGTSVVLSNSPTLTLSVCIICSTFFICIFVVLIKLGYDRNKLK